MIVHGFDESINTCDCCGRTDLKGTFTVENPAGEYLHYGCVCVTRHTNKTNKQINKEIDDRKELAKQSFIKELQNSQEYLKHEVMMNEAHKLGLCGISFRKYVSETLDALHIVQKRISEKHGVSYYGN